MKKRRIVFVSVLNPVDDTRMFEKMGASLAQHKDYEIFILGQPSNSKPAHAGIHFIPFKKVKRLSIDRLLLPLQIGLKLIKVKPELLIVNTHELLIVSLLNRILFGCQIVYDLRENYYRNIKYAESFSPWLRTPLALVVRLKEMLITPLFHHFILAEKSYQKELKFIGQRFSILENKAVLTQPFQRIKGSSFNLLFSGTMARSTGVFHAIELADSLHQIDSKVTLTIIGYCAIDAIRIDIRKEVKDKPFIRLIGFDEPVAHGLIIQEIMQADFGIIYYPPLPHTSGSVPTKLYEYLAYQLPILTWETQSFVDMIKTNEAGLIVSGPHESLLRKMVDNQFYPRPPENVYWEKEKFQRLIEKLLR